MQGTLKRSRPEESTCVAVGCYSMVCLARKLRACERERPDCSRVWLSSEWGSMTIARNQWDCFETIRQLRVVLLWQLYRCWDFCVARFSCHRLLLQNVISFWTRRRNFRFFLINNLANLMSWIVFARNEIFDMNSLTSGSTSGNLQFGLVVRHFQLLFDCFLAFGKQVLGSATLWIEFGCGFGLQLASLWIWKVRCNKWRTRQHRKLLPIGNVWLYLDRLE